MRQYVSVQWCLVLGLLVLFVPKVQMKQLELMVWAKKKCLQPCSFELLPCSSHSLRMLSCVL